MNSKTKQSKKKNYSLYIRADLVQKLNQLAAERRMSFSQTVSEILKQFFEENP